MPQTHIKNFKVSFYLPQASQHSASIQSKQPLASRVCHSFYVWRTKFVFTLFYKGHVNCTKITSLEEIGQAQQELATLLDISPASAIDYRIDNITASFTSHQPILVDAFACFVQQFDLVAHYNPLRFPGAKIKTSFGTILIFSSGKASFIGSQSVQAIQSQEKLLLSILNAFHRMHPPPTLHCHRYP